MDAPPEVAAANAAARAMLRDHLREYVERNGEDASCTACRSIAMEMTLSSLPPLPSSMDMSIIKSKALSPSSAVFLCLNSIFSEPNYKLFALIC